MNANGTSGYWNLRPVVLENDLLRIIVFPELGAKIYSLIYKPLQEDILWHNPAIKPAIVSPSSPFDDVWCGGWDEIFPNDAPCIVDGKHYPDMGEVWSIPWAHSLIRNREHPPSATLQTSVRNEATPCKLTRFLTLRDGESSVHVRYLLENFGDKPLRFLWKLHPAFDINETCTIEIPASTGIIDPRYRHLYSDHRAMYKWPYATNSEGREIDVSRVPPSTEQTCSLHYVTDLKDGVAKFNNPKRNLSVTIRFPKEIFDNVWLFLAYGGYRSLYTAVIEPSTSYPYDLGEAIREGHCSRLDPGQKLDCHIEVELRTLK